MKINRAWHEKHRMPKNASLIQRMNWHIAHANHCGCRQMPASIVSALKRKDLKTRSRGHKYVDTGSCPVCWPGRNKNSKTS